MNCIVCGNKASQRCSACRTVYYCCRVHQREDWPNHKQECFALLQRLCVYCEHPTKSYCEYCTSTFKEPSSVTSDGFVYGRAICDACDDVYGACPPCIREQDRSPQIAPNPFAFLQRPCVYCELPTGSYCDHCTNTFKEPSSATSDGFVYGRAICTACDEVWGACPPCIRGA